MEYIKTDIQGVMIIRPRIITDTRGYFMETYRDSDFKAQVCDTDFVQDNESASSYGVVRGLHFQDMPHSQSKLVRCVSGKVLDVAVDLRSGSPTFGRHVAVILDSALGTQLFIPRGFAHGYAVLSERALFQYKCDAYYHPESEGGIDPFDPELGIDWGIDRLDAIVSDKDMARPRLADIADRLHFSGNLYDRI